MADPQPLDLATHLTALLPPNTRPTLREQVLPSLLHSISQIATALRSSSQVSQVGTANAFGDDQLNVDVLAETILRKTIAACPAIATASSEEDPVEVSRPLPDLNPASAADDEETYTLAFDPLDGSSIIAPNWTVGTIIGLWDGRSALHQDPATRQIGAILGVFGPRTTAFVALRIPGACAPTCFEVALGSAASGEHNIVVVRTHVALADPPSGTRYFAPANLRAAAEDDRYMQLIARFVRDKYTLRYSGGLVPDVVHALVKGHGVYVSPVTEKSRAKLRRLYELAPVALVVECAGGAAVDAGTGERILGKAIEDTDERAGLVCGTREDVEMVSKALLA